MAGKEKMSHYCENHTCKLWKETWPTWERLGPIVHGPCWLSSNVQSAPSIPLLPQLSQVGGTIELFGVGWGAMGSTDFTQLLSLLSIAQRLEWRGQTQKDSGSNPGKVKFSTYKRKTKPDQHSVDRPPSYLLPTASVPLLWEPYVQTLKGDLTNLRTSGAHSSWAHAGFPPMSRVLPLYHCSPSFHKWGALLNCSGWVWGPWDLPISPNFYPCFQ